MGKFTILWLLIIFLYLLSLAVVGFWLYNLTFGHLLRKQGTDTVPDSYHLFCEGPYKESQFVSSEMDTEIESCILKMVNRGYTSLHRKCIEMNMRVNQGVNVFSVANCVTNFGQSGEKEGEGLLSMTFDGSRRQIRCLGNDTYFGKEGSIIQYQISNETYSLARMWQDNQNGKVIIQGELGKAENKKESDVERVKCKMCFKK